MDPSRLCRQNVVCDCMERHTVYCLFILIRLGSIHIVHVPTHWWNETIVLFTLSIQVYSYWGNIPDNTHSIICIDARYTHTKSINNISFSTSYAQFVENSFFLHPIHSAVSLLIIYFQYYSTCHCLRLTAIDVVRLIRIRTRVLWLTTFITNEKKNVLSRTRNTPEKKN